MEEGFSRRVFLPDVRGEERYLRVTWHRDTSTMVFSHWRGDVCVASTPISLDDASRLIATIVGALKEAAVHATPASDPQSTANEPPNATGLLASVRRRLKPQLAHVVRFPERRRQGGTTEERPGT